MPIVSCKICLKDFYTKPSWIQKGMGKYCSTLCYQKSKKNGKSVSCFICKKITYKTQKALKHSKSKKYFCGKSCQTKWRNQEFVGANHANWTGGLFSYRNVLKRAGIPKTCKLCKTRDARVLAVHHINLNHKDNRIENLAWLCQNCHFLVHHHKDEYKKFMEALV